jgi:CRP-like cAMP-binding protein
MDSQGERVMSTTLLASLLIRKLERFEPWSADERQSVLDAVDSTLRLPAHAHLVQEGESSDGVHVVLEGFVCGYKLLPDGRRQIVSYCVPGDLCDLRIVLLPRTDCTLGTISPSLVARLSRERFRALLFQFPRLGRAFWKTALIDQAIAREWLINVGQRTAFSRAAHLLCEMFLRLRAVGLVQENTCEFPLTQTEIADTLALSTVHVNRTLMELRRSGLITLRDKQLTIHHLPALEAAAGFTPAYLHLEATMDDDVTPAV